MRVSECACACVSVRATHEDNKKQASKFLRVRESLPSLYANYFHIILLSVDVFVVTAS